MCLTGSWNSPDGRTKSISPDGIALVLSVIVALAGTLRSSNLWVGSSAAWGTAVAWGSAAVWGTGSTVQSDAITVLHRRRGTHGRVSGDDPAERHCSLPILGADHQITASASF